MKKTIIGAAALGAVIVAFRRFGPALGQRAMKKCEQMMERMPEDSPPKRIMRSLDELREQNARILRYFEEERAQGSSSAGN